MTLCRLKFVLTLCLWIIIVSLLFFGLNMYSDEKFRIQNFNLGIVCCYTVKIEIGKRVFCCYTFFFSFKYVMLSYTIMIVLLS